jgi:prepilin-type N-terminal cleavage/methylation domain-containing protein
VTLRRPTTAADKHNGLAPAGLAPRPSSRAPRRAAIGRDAFTLIEVLLTLSLMVVLASLSWPSLARPMANQALRSGADEVRTSWAKARVAAMSTGRTYVFHAPEADHYVVECHVAPEAAGEMSENELAAAQGNSALDSGPRAAEKHPLPQRVRFVGGKTVVDARDQSAAVSSGPVSDAALSQVDPIFFYPDGTTSTARVQLQNEYGRMMELSLRGLTGVATVSAIEETRP